MTLVSCASRMHNEHTPLSPNLHGAEWTGHANVDVESVESVETVAAVSSADRANDNVFRVLAAQARARPAAQLWVAALGGLVDAGLLWWRHPMLTWLGGGCAAVAAYGVWGLLDRAVQRRASVSASAGKTLAQVRGLRDLTAIAGTVLAVWAVLSFMAVALSNWNH